MLGGDRRMIDSLFEASIADVLDEYISDQRLKDRVVRAGDHRHLGAGRASRGTASVKLMHYQGDLTGEGPIWGYVEGGMGMISFAIADAAQDAGAVLACGVPVGEILPGEGVPARRRRRSIAASIVVCNADPKRVLAMLDGHEAMPPTTARGWGAGRSAARW